MNRDKREERRGMIVAASLVVVMAGGLLLVGNGSETAPLDAPPPASTTSSAPPSTSTTSTTVPHRPSVTDADVDNDGRPDPLSFVVIEHPATGRETRLRVGLSRLGRKEASIFVLGDQPPIVAAAIDMDGDPFPEILIQIADQIGLRHFVVVRLVNGTLRAVNDGDQPFQLTTGRGAQPAPSGVIYSMGFECRDAVPDHPGPELVIKQADSDSPNDNTGVGGDTMYGRVLVSYFDDHEAIYITESIAEEAFSLHDKAKLTQYSTTSCGSFTG